MNRYRGMLGVAGAVVWVVAGASVAGAGEWRTIHHDNQRSGHTAEELRGPFERKWYRDFHDEMIATRVEGIVAGGRCFVGTFSGNLHALKVEDGSAAWTFRAGGAIGASAHYEAGRVIVGADDGVLYCLDAADGKVVWQYRAASGIWVAPACDGKQVYFGDRSGQFHAVSLADGTRRWTVQTGGMILTPASITVDGARLVFGSEDMHVYCVDAGDGRLRWKSAKLQGLSLRDHGPTIWKDLVIVRTNPADGFHQVMDRSGHVLKEIQRKIPLREGEKVLLDKWNDYIVTPSAERRKAEQDGVVEHLKQNPHDQTFYALRIEDGTEPWVAPVFYTCGLHNPATPPVFDPKTGELYTIYRTAMTTYLRGIRRYSAIGRVSRETGRIEWSWPETEAQQTWHAMSLIGDETQALSLMGEQLIGNHQGVLAMLDLKTLKLGSIWQARDTYGGIFGPAAVPGGFEGARKLAAEGFLTGTANEWHGPDRSIIAIAEDRAFWVVGSQVVCLGGPDAAKTASGGTKAPEPFKSRLPLVPGGNVAAGGIGRFDAALPKLVITAEDLRALLEPPAAVKPSATPLAAEVRRRLDGAVLELVEGWPWAPLVVELGISGEERFFWRSSETIAIVAEAMPQLSAPVREKARGFLAKLVAGGAPMNGSVNPREGRRRELYELGPGMQRWAAAEVRHSASIADVHALWAYAHHAQDWEGARRQMAAAKRVFEASAAAPAAIDDVDAKGEDAAEHLNARIAGVLGYARLAAHFGEEGEAKRAMALLAELATERVHHERADSALVRATRTASHSLHQAKVPRYLEMTPELGAMLRRFAREELEGHGRTLTRALPVWYQAFGERMIGGENYISAPHLSRAIFAALAQGEIARPEELVRYLDQPWCRADLYFVEKCAAVLRGMGQKAEGRRQKDEG